MIRKMRTQKRRSRKKNPLTGKFKGKYYHSRSTPKLFKENYNFDEPVENKVPSDQEKCL